MQKKFTSIALIFLLSACTTVEVYNADKTAGSWEAKAQIRDLVNNKSYNTSLDITATWPNSLRMDVSGPMGVALATMAFDKEDIQVSLYRQKKFYEGHLSDQALQPLFKINLNPKLFLNVAFDKDFASLEWKCLKDEKSIVQSCERKSDGLKVMWKERQGEKKRILISDQKYELEILFKSFSQLDSTKVSETSDPYRLSAPEGFSKYNIP